MHSRHPALVFRPNVTRAMFGRLAINSLILNALLKTTPGLNLRPTRTRIILSRTAAVHICSQIDPTIINVRAQNNNNDNDVISTDNLVLAGTRIINDGHIIAIRLDSKHVFRNSIINCKTGHLSLTTIQLQNGPAGLPAITVTPPGSIQIKRDTLTVNDPFNLRNALAINVIDHVSARHGLVRASTTVGPKGSNKPLLGHRKRLVKIGASVFAAKHGNNDINVKFTVPASTVRDFLTSIQSNRTDADNADHDSHRPATVTVGTAIRNVLSSDDGVLPSNDFFGPCIFRKQTKRQIAVSVIDNSVSTCLVIVSLRDKRFCTRSSSNNNGLGTDLSLRLPCANDCLVFTGDCNRNRAKHCRLQLDRTSNNNSKNNTSRSNSILQIRNQLNPNDSALQSNSCFRRMAFQKQTERSIHVHLRDHRFSACLFLFSRDNGLVNRGSSVDHSGAGSRLTIALPHSKLCHTIIETCSPENQKRFLLAVS